MKKSHQSRQTLHKNGKQKAVRRASEGKTTAQLTLQHTPRPPNGGRGQAPTRPPKHDRTQSDLPSKASGRAGAQDGQRPEKSGVGGGKGPRTDGRAAAEAEWGEDLPPALVAQLRKRAAIERGEDVDDGVDWGHETAREAGVYSEEGEEGIVSQEVDRMLGAAPTSRPATHRSESCPPPELPSSLADEYLGRLPSSLSRPRSKSTIGDHGVGGGEGEDGWGSHEMDGPEVGLKVIEEEVTEDGQTRDVKTRMQELEEEDRRREVEFVKTRAGAVCGSPLPVC